MARLSKRVEKWAQAGIITSAQAQKILDFERKDGFFGARGVFMTLGALSVSLGILSLIAAHWDEISDAFKLTAMFAVLTGNAYAAAKCRQKRPRAFEALLVLQALLTVGCVGLVAQIFNLAPDERAFFRFVSLLTLPLLCATRKPYLFFAFFPAAYAGFLDEFVGKYIWRFFRGELFGMALTTVLVACAVIVLSRKLPERFAPMRAALTFYLYVGVFLFLLYSYHSWGHFFVQIALLFALCADALRTNGAGLFRWTSFCIALRVFFGFIDLFGSLTQTGVGLIAFGVLIVVLASAWYELQKRLLRFFKTEKAS